MIYLPPREESRVWDALNSGEAFHARPILYIGNDDYSDRLKQCEWGQSEIPITLSEAYIGSVIPRRLEGAPVRFYAEVNGVLIPQLMGRYTLPMVGEDRSSTEFLASSGGALLSRVRLREFKEYGGVPPEYIIRDALYRVANVGGYEKSLIQVDPMGSPILYFVGDEGFKYEEKAEDVLSRVFEQVPNLVVRDTAEGGAVAEVSLALGREEEVAYSFNASDIPNWVPPQRAEEQYSEVEVFRENPDGSDAYRQKAEIVYRGLDFPPFADTPFIIPLNDDSAEGPKNAQELANERSEAFGRGIYTSSDTETILPVFWPLIAKLDVFRVNETHRDDDGLWDRAWHLRVDSFKHVRSLGEINTTVDGYTAVLLVEDKIDVPSLIVPEVSTGVLSPPVMVPYGIDGDDLWFSEGLDWVSIDGDDLVFTTDAPAFIDGDDLVITDAGL